MRRSSCALALAWCAAAAGAYVDVPATAGVTPACRRGRSSPPARVAASRMIEADADADADADAGAGDAAAADDAKLLLDVTGLQATVVEKPILKGVNLKIRRGEVHAIMGPNGSGKSTLSKVLVGHPSYEVTGGAVSYRGDDLLDSEPQERAQQGIFLAFQYPVEIPGVSNSDFLRLAVNKRRGAQGEEEYDPIEFLGVLADKMETVGMSPDFLGRDVNSGFSGGEKKRNEILQMALLEPELAILDETDSGLDIDALKTVASGVNACRSEDNAIVLITHYQRLLDYIKPDYVHVMYKGQIVRSGGPELALELERDGYAFLGLKGEAAALI